LYSPLHEFLNHKLHLDCETVALAFVAKWLRNGASFATNISESLSSEKVYLMLLAGLLAQTAIAIK